MDGLQIKKEEISQKIDQSKNKIQNSIQNDNLSQNIVDVYQRNFEELNSIKRSLDKNFKDIYSKMKLEYEKAVLLGRRDGQKHDSIDLGIYLIQI